MENSTRISWHYWVHHKIKFPPTLGEPDEYKPLEPTRVFQLLGPLEWMVKRTCYANKFSKVASLLAAKFVAEKRPVRMRFLAMIYESASWAY